MLKRVQHDKQELFTSPSRFKGKVLKSTLINGSTKLIAILFDGMRFWICFNFTLTLTLSLKGEGGFSIIFFPLPLPLGRGLR